MCFYVLSKAKKVCFIFSPTWSPLCGSFLSYVTKQKRKKWRKLIKRSIFWSKISKKDYLQQGDTSFMFKNRQNNFFFFNFDKKTRKLIVANQVLTAITGKFWFPCMRNLVKKKKVDEKFVNQFLHDIILLMASGGQLALGWNQIFDLPLLPHAQISKSQGPQNKTFR